MLFRSRKVGGNCAREARPARSSRSRLLLDVALQPGVRLPERHRVLVVVGACADLVADVLRKGIKIRREAVEQYTAAGRQDLAQVETAQITVLDEFLPPAVDPEEIRAAVRNAIAGGAQDMGKVMSQIMPKYKGRADGKLINQIVREELQAG